MSIKSSIAHASSPHGWFHIYHESDVDSLDEMNKNDDVYFSIAFGRTETTHRIPKGVFDIIVNQLQRLPNTPDMKTAPPTALGGHT